MAECNDINNQKDIQSTYVKGVKQGLNIDLKAIIQPENYVKGIVFSEILGKPKSMRRGLR